MAHIILDDEEGVVPYGHMDERVRAIVMGMITREAQPGSKLV